MPEVNEGAGSSPAEEATKPTEEALASEVVATDAKTAESSVADTNEPDAKTERAESLDLTLKALGKGEKATDGEASSTSEGDDGKQKEGKEVKDGKDAEKADDPDKDLPFHKHPRWQEVTKRNAALEEENTSMKRDLEDFRAIESFREQHRLSVDEVSDGYKIMALIKNDPAKALPYLEGLVDDIKGVTGHKLPEDLQADVDAGAITEERALELSIARASSTSATAREKEARERQTTEQRSRLSEELGRAGEDWTAKAKQADPEFSQKERLVVRRIKEILRDDPKRTPRTVDDVHKLSDEALADVNSELSGLLTRKATPPSPAGVSVTAAAAAKSAPQTPLDITRQALGM